jgi:SagB-type dehydrogenase family enzyme
MLMGCAVAFFWVAVPYRMTWRYGERGFRYLYLDAGHVCQNLYLASETIGAGTCAVGAFDDDALNALLGLDESESFVIYLAAVGKKPPGQ